VGFKKRQIEFIGETMANEKDKIVEVSLKMQPKVCAGTIVKSRNGINITIYRTIGVLIESAKGVKELIPFENVKSIVFESDNYEVL
jgi:hypothetical protein